MRFEQNLEEISGADSTVLSTLILLRHADQLEVCLIAEDPDMLNLTASIGEPDTDHFLYEEDCLQLAVLTASGITTLLVNPQGKRNGNTDWRVTIKRHATMAIFRMNLFAGGGLQGCIPAFPSGPACVVLSRMYGRNCPIYYRWSYVPGKNRPTAGWFVALPVLKLDGK